MKHKLLKILVVGLAVCSLFSMSSMLTQDELGEVISRKNQLIKSGMSADEVNSLMDGITDWQEAVKVLDKKMLKYPVERHLLRRQQQLLLHLRLPPRLQPQSMSISTV